MIYFHFLGLILLHHFYHTPPQLVFHEKTIEASLEEIEEMTTSASEDIAAMDKVLALHTELHEQEKILAMYTAQRDEALAEKTKQEETLNSLRNEEATLQSCIRDRRSTEERHEALLSRLQMLEEMNDLFTGHLSSWKLELTPTLPSKGGQTRLVYTHMDGSSIL